ETAPGLSDPGLGRVRPPGSHRNPPVWRRKHPGRPALASHAGKPDPDLAGETCRVAPSGVDSAEPRDPPFFPGTGRSRPGRGRRFPGGGRQACPGADTRGGGTGHGSDRSGVGRGPRREGTSMIIDLFVKILSGATVFEMMVALGLGVTAAELA